MDFKTRLGAIVVGATIAAAAIGGGIVGLPAGCAANGSDFTVVACATPTYGGGGGGGGLSTAVLWVSAAGNDATCVRSTNGLEDYATALNASPTNVCKTGTKAYQKANTGDTVLVEGTPYTVTSSWNFTKSISKSIAAGHCNYNYGGTATLDQCVIIEPAQGQSLTFDVTGANITQVTVCVSGLSIQNATWTETDYLTSKGVNVSNNALVVGSGDSSCVTSGNSTAYDDYFTGLTVGGQADIIGGATNVYINNSTAVSTTDFPWQFGGLGGCGPPCTTGPVTTSGLIGDTFQGYNFANTDPGSHHMECVHANGAITNSFVAASRFDQCPVESLFFETLNTNSNVTGDVIENNYFDEGSGGGPFKMDCAQANCTVSNNTIRFNSFNGPWSLECSAGSGNSCNIDNNVFYGNLNIGCVAVTFFPAGGSITGTGWVDQGYNVVNVAKANTCTANTSSYSATVTYVSPGSPSYNLDLSGAQTATNFVPNSVTWPLTNQDIHGNARSGTNTDAGAN